MQVSMFEAKSSLSRLVEALEQKREKEILITRSGHLVAKLVPIGAKPTNRRIGVAKGKFKMPESIDACNKEIEVLFSGGVL